jgi:hypothetical protein
MLIHCKPNLMIKLFQTMEIRTEHFTFTGVNIALPVLIVRVRCVYYWLHNCVSYFSGHVYSVLRVRGGWERLWGCLSRWWIAWTACTVYRSRVNSWGLLTQHSPIFSIHWTAVLPDIFLKLLAVIITQFGISTEAKFLVCLRYDTVLKVVPNRQKETTLEKKRP